MALGNVAPDEGRFDEARTLVDDALRRIRQRGEGGLPIFLDKVRRALGDSTYDAAWTTGQSLTVEQAVRLALGEPQDER